MKLFAYISSTKPGKVLNLGLLEVVTNYISVVVSPFLNLAYVGSLFYLNSIICHFLLLFQFALSCDPHVSVQSVAVNTGFLCAVFWW
jgi:hypothetical protein